MSGNGASVKSPALVDAFLGALLERYAWRRAWADAMARDHADHGGEG